MNQLTTTPNGWASALLPATTDDAWKIAQTIAKSSLVPKAFANNPGDILIAGAMGARLGLDIFSALQSLAVVNGRPTLYGDALLGICQSRPDWRGMSVAWDGSGDAEVCTVTVRRANAGGEVDACAGRFGVADAKKAGLWSKQGPWSQFPRRMMEMRARAYALRGAFADALMGFHSREEMEDATPAEFEVRPEPRTRTRVVKPALPTVSVEQEPSSAPAAVEPEQPAGPATTATSEAPAAGEEPIVVEGADAPADLPATPTEDDVRNAVNYAASAAGGAKAVVAEVAKALGYAVSKAADIKPEDRAKAIAVAEQMAGL